MVQRSRLKRPLVKFSLVFLGILAFALVFMATRDSYTFECASLQGLIHAWGAWAPVYFCLLYVLATLGFLPGLALTLTAGMAFGIWWGTLIVVIGAALGATLAFLIARYLIRDAVEKRLRQRHWFKQFEESLLENGFNYILFVRLVPLFPFSGINFASGVLPIKLKHYFFGSLLGMIPGTFAYVYLGEAGCKLIDPLLRGEFKMANIPVEVRINALVALAMLAFLSLLPLWVKKHWRGRK